MDPPGSGRLKNKWILQVRIRIRIRWFNNILLECCSANWPKFHPHNSKGIDILTKRPKKYEPNKKICKWEENLKCLRYFVFIKPTY